MPEPRNTMSLCVIPGPWENVRLLERLGKMSAPGHQKPVDIRKLAGFGVTAGGLLLNQLTR